MTQKSPPTGSPCWIDIPAVDVEACKEFYSTLFPSWEFKEPTEAKLAMWSFASPSGLSGGIVQVSASCKNNKLQNGMGVTVYHFVESIDEIKKRVEGLGGLSCSGKEKAGDHGMWMYFKDVEGNRFGVYEMIAGEGGH
ncbi:uncharacterized protein K444DRAFT_605837 [Hyaloscypha bicolor E]|uniref:VOC domain-containing protein n=1 Tax=Hyaloscypha bicolor E TaxID=1095630 RepID=A0A2J6TV25_9HELO|nr:uncharacterized protein K444DRAFT_605837 [Hyaloscypha bicolor E]PMD66841.1 hypothetical protein K444DRAFT_605837 [Hyaloscypha bicolor E]